MELETLPVTDTLPKRPDATYRGRRRRDSPSCLANEANLTTGAVSSVPGSTDKRSDARLLDPFRKLAIWKWWQHYIDPWLLVQDHAGGMPHDPRDFLALERTHLGYMRTCNALALFGVVTAQAFVLKAADSVHGRWLAATAFLLAIGLAMTSGVRTIWIQNKLIEGRTATVFWLNAVFVVMIVSLVVLVLVFNVLA